MAGGDNRTLMEGAEGRGETLAERMSDVRYLGRRSFLLRLPKEPIWPQPALRGLLGRGVLFVNSLASACFVPVALRNFCPDKEDSSESACVGDSC